MKGDLKALCTKKILRKITISKTPSNDNTYLNDYEQKFKTLC